MIHLLHIGHSKMSLDQLLDQQPPIQEITTHARTEKWNELGIQLQLDSVNLAGCHSLASMYQLWIQEKADKATRRSLLDALRAIKQNDVARIYEYYLKTLVSYTVYTYSKYTSYLNTSMHMVCGYVNVKFVLLNN